MILASDTSGKSLSVALCEDEYVIAESTLNFGYKHSVTFQPLLADILTRAGRDKRDLDLLACTVGPGSFTGIRIGVAAMKTMAWALEKPVIGVSSLEVLAAAFPVSLVCPAIDARGGRVFSALYDVGANFRVLIEPANRQASELRSKIHALNLEQEIVITGDGSPAVRSACPEEIDLANAIWATPEFWLPRASTLSRLALQRYRAGDPGDPFKLRPNYLALSQAERMRKQSKESI